MEHVTPMFDPTTAKAALVTHGNRWHQSKASERAAREATYGAIREAAAAGLSESEIARLARVNRMTVLRALGKREMTIKPKRADRPTG